MWEHVGITDPEKIKARTRPTRPSRSRILGKMNSTSASNSSPVQIDAEMVQEEIKQTRNEDRVLLEGGPTRIHARTSVERFGVPCHVFVVTVGARPTGLSFMMKLPQQNPGGTQMVRHGTIRWIQCFVSCTHGRLWRCSDWRAGVCHISVLFTLLFGAHYAKKKSSHARHGSKFVKRPCPGSLTRLQLKGLFSDNIDWHCYFTSRSSLRFDVHVHYEKTLSVPNM